MGKLLGSRGNGGTATAPEGAATAEQLSAEREPADTSLPSARENLSDEPDGLRRHRLIQEAAYQRFIARGYVDGYAEEDWLLAEADVDQQLRAAARGI